MEGAEGGHLGWEAAGGNAAGETGWVGKVRGGCARGCGDGSCECREGGLEIAFWLYGLYDTFGTVRTVGELCFDFALDSGGGREMIGGGCVVSYRTVQDGGVVRQEEGDEYRAGETRGHTRMYSMYCRYTNRHRDSDRHRYCTGLFLW